jgi:hypothetical protein
MRVWTQLLHEKHPGTTWLPVKQESEHPVGAGKSDPATAQVATADNELAEAA